MSIVGGVCWCPCLTVHSAVDTLGLVVVAQDVSDDLVADRWLASGGRVTAVVGGLGSTGSGASSDTIVVCLDHCGVEGEELVAHVGVLFGNRVERSIDCTTELNWAAETGLSSWSGVLVVTIGS